MSGLRVALEQAGPIPLAAAFDCPRGQLLALVGPSGSGKSTILRCIAGLHRAQRGRVECGGVVLFDSAGGVDVSPQQRRVGMVFQDYALFPHLSVLDNVTLPLRALPAAERERIGRGLLERTRIAGLEARRPHQLSGGEQQRVALARALARDPAVLLLDEPFSAVDQVTRHRLRLELASLSRTLEVPIVLVTHDLDEASMLADQVCVLHRGETLQQGAPDAVLARPASAQVARLIDMRNLFEAQLNGHSAEQGWSELGWGGRTLRCAYAPGYDPGSRVAWCISPTNVLLIPERLRREEGENGLDTAILDLLVGSALTQAVLKCAGPPGLLLHMTLPTRVARRHALAVGGSLRISLPREAIHLMPAAAREGGRRAPT